VRGEVNPNPTPNQEEYVRGEANPNPTPNQEEYMRGEANPNPTPNQEEYVRGEAPLNFRVSLGDGNEYVPHYSFQSGGQGSALLTSGGPRTDGPTPGELRAMRGDALGALVTWEAVKGSKVGSPSPSP